MFQLVRFPDVVLVAKGIVVGIRVRAQDQGAEILRETLAWPRHHLETAFAPSGRLPGKHVLRSVRRSVVGGEHIDMAHRLSGQ